MMGWLGLSKEKVENYWQEIKATDFKNEPTISLRLLPKYGFSDKFHVAWLNPQGKDPKFKRLWTEILTDYQKQVHYLKKRRGGF